MEEKNINRYVCKNPQVSCKFPEDGICLEDLPPPATCPFRKLASAVATDDPTDSKTAEGAAASAENVEVHLGEALTEEDCNLLMSDVPVKFIMLAGLRKSGKTTSLACLFQLFQERPSFAETKFAGSSTLVGFERLCHPSRIASELETEQTIRTPKGQKGFLHFRLMSENQLSRKADFVFTDISGEDYDDLSKSTDYCKKFVIAKRADHFVLFMDAGRLSEITTRHAVNTSSISVLMSLLEANMIPADALIDVVFSRYDLLNFKKDAAKHENFLKQIREDIKQRLKPYNFAPSFFEIASRPSAGNLKFGHGLDKLLTHWMNSCNAKKVMAENTLPTKPLTRQFTKFKASQI